MFAVNQHMANHSYPCYVFSRSAWGRRISPWFLTLVLAGYVLKFAVTYGLPPLF
ncbi:MAG: hypothetical protein JWN48_924 [Myxococcaceae bacterium]|nr:hypothetical protein [Myxococcaceae bacterium]